jgi:xanthine dehydrogenase YagS FAD-binding subunit
MRPFAFAEPETLQEVFTLLDGAQNGACLMAGGSDLLGLLKEDVAHYEHLVSLAGIDALRHIRQEADGLHLGASLTLTQLEYEPRLQGPYRILADAARGVATPEIRNQGTLGGNLCQRPRCLHYRSALIPCLKKGGADCPALDSPYQHYLSIMGGHGCFSVHASDLAPALIALDAQVTLAGPSGERTLPLHQFFAGPQREVQRENVLASHEVLTDVIVPEPFDGWRGTYLKARERTAGDFPLVSVAVGYALQEGRIRQARVVLGGVAPIPWPSAAAVAALEGEPLSAELAARAAEAALAEAQPLRHNAFKVEIGRALVARAILAVGTV